MLLKELDKPDSRLFSQPKQKIKPFVEFISRMIGQKNILYRGSYSLKFYKDDFYIGDSSNSVRKSKNTENYYTEWLEYDPRWKDYPLRSRSWICSNNIDTANAFNSSNLSESAAIFPLENVKIGICPAYDFWDSFTHISANMVNNMLKKDLKANNIEFSIDNLKKIKCSLTDNDTTWYNYYSTYFDPIKYKFNVDVRNNINKYNGIDREIWFSGKAILIPQSASTSIEAFNKWLGK